MVNNYLAVFVDPIHVNVDHFDIVVDYGKTFPFNTLLSCYRTLVYFTFELVLDLYPNKARNLS